MPLRICIRSSLAQRLQRLTLAAGIWLILSPIRLLAVLQVLAALPALDFSPITSS
jgi:hypothetical protein